MRLRLGKIWNDNNLVFPNTTGGYIEPTVVSRALKRTVRKSGIDRHIRVHDLRHTCGSVVYQNHVTAKEIQKILGHKNIQITLDLYIHTNTERLRDATDTLDKAINE